MAQPTSAVDICNLALDILGDAPINSIASPSTEDERLLSRWYDQTRQELLRKYIWNFSKRRANLSRIGAPAFDYSDEYQLPSDFIRLLSIGANPRERPLTAINFDIEGRKLLVDAEGAATIKARYVADISVVTEFDSLFINILYLSLALKMAYKKTKRRTLVSDINGLLAADLIKATSVDGQEKPPIQIKRSKYNAARRGRNSNINSYYNDGTLEFDA